MSTVVANAEQAGYWNAGEAAHWLACEDRYEAMLAPFTGHLLRAAAVSRPGWVLDAGCGCGGTTRAAGRVVIGGEALGVDLPSRLLRSSPMPWPRASGSARRHGWRRPAGWPEHGRRP